MRPVFLFLLFLPFTAQAQPVPVEGLPRVVFYSFASEGDTLLAGAHTVYVSVDRGKTWHAASSIAEGVDFVDAIAMTEAGWFVGTSPHGIFRSTDRGETWASLNTGLNGLGALEIVDFAARGTFLYAATGGAGIFMLDLQNPTVWHSIGTVFEDNEAGGVNALTRLDDRLIAPAGGNGLVFSQANEQAPWTFTLLVPGRYPSPRGVDVEPMGAQLIVATASRAYFSADGGESWQPTGPILRRGFATTLAASEHRAYLSVTVSDQWSDLYTSTDLNAPWTYVGLLPEIVRLYAYDDRLYIAQEDGLHMLPFTPVANEPEIPVSPRLTLNLEGPHPLRDHATFQFTTDQPMAVRLEVFDVLGRNIGTLFDGPVYAGSHRASWEAASFPAGVYLVRLTGDAGAITRRVVVQR